MAYAQKKKPKRFFDLEEYKKAEPPKAYSPVIQPTGYRIELVDWGNGESVSISKFTGKSFTTVTIPKAKISAIVDMILKLATQ